MPRYDPSDPKQQIGVWQFIGASVALIASTLWNTFWWFTTTFASKPGRNHIGDWSNLCLITLVPTAIIGVILAWRGKGLVGVFLVLPSAAIAFYYLTALLPHD